jgi:hypothetical protein
MFVWTSPHYTKPLTTAATFEIPVYVRGEERNKGVREGVDRLEEEVKIMLGKWKKNTPPP